jgi:serine/threonine protein kinase
MLVSGSIHVGQSADIWSLGVLLYAIMTGGRHPSDKAKYDEQKDWAQTLPHVRLLTVLRISMLVYLLIFVLGPGPEPAEP